MKKLSYLVLLSLFAFFGCQTDTPEIEATEMKRNADASIEVGIFTPISEKHKANPEAFLDQQFADFSKSDEQRYGCVTFVDGLAIIDIGCSITSGVPRDVRDCDLVAVRVIVCGTNPFNTLCTICAVAYVVECDGELGWILGFNIVCAASPVPF